LFVGICCCNTRSAAVYALLVLCILFGSIIVSF
jgi:hypothetical protein